ncbi:MAG: type II secretion system protein GspD [Gammaproteobacteria bacterium HGW-Gammaproteobacteria-10]|nr:MAG: type II secretion system protein GspD [Gammaproteobacteria bacterium HGW-Gammaproteobacteria-10]
MNKVNRIHATVLALLTLSTGGCELLGAQARQKLTLAQPKVDDLEAHQKFFEQLGEEAEIDDKDKLHPEIFPGTGLPVGDVTRRAGPPIGQGSYSLNFDEADLGEVAKVIIGDILGKNYVLSPKVAGKVTLQTTQPLTREQVLPTLEMLLSMNSAALVKDEGGVYHIEPAADALYTSALSLADRRGRVLPAGYQVSVIPVRNVGVDNIVEILKPLLQEKTLLHSDPSRNLLLVGGNAAELLRVQEIVGIFDVDMMRGRSFALFPLTHVDPPTVIEELEQIFDNKGKDDKGQYFRFIAIERMNAILAITHQSRYLSDIENWIIRLDRAQSATGGGVNVYKVQHVDAVQLAATLSEIYGVPVSQSGMGQASVAPGRRAVEVTSRPQQGGGLGGLGGQIRQVQRPMQTPGIAGTGVKVKGVEDVRIIPDEINNSLVIVATAQEYNVIKGVIKQLDVMPLQVLIDATIVDVTLTDELRYGIRWFFEHGDGSLSGGGTHGPNTSNVVSTLGPMALGAMSGGFGYAFLAKDIKAVLNAEASKGNTNIISSPSLMVLNNQEASIQVGKEISLRTGTTTPLGGTTAAPDNSLIATQQLQQRQTGVKLKIKPRVNAGGLVIMEIEQSVEDPLLAGNTGNPEILTREIMSSVAVQSGETIVLGGLIQENNNYGRAGVPWLHELPLIGPLFGSTDTSTTKTELVILLTPRVVTGRQDARLVADEFKRKLTGIYHIEPTEMEIR